MRRNIDFPCPDADLKTAAFWFFALAKADAGSAPVHRRGYRNDSLNIGYVQDIVKFFLPIGMASDGWPFVICAPVAFAPWKGRRPTVWT